MWNLHRLVVLTRRHFNVSLALLCIVLFTDITEQVSLSCGGGDMAVFSEQDVRVVDGFNRSSNDLVFIGSDQNVTVIDGTNVVTHEVGVCYSSIQVACYKRGDDPANCDNYIRSVTALSNPCTPIDCRVLVCGTNARFPRCSFCDYDGAMVNCSFEENVPPQDLPYDGASFTSECLNGNINGEDIFQAIKNENASVVYDNGKLYYGVADNSDNDDRFSLAGLVSVNDQGVFTGSVITRQDSQKMVATGADFVGTPFIRGDYAYFLFRESDQEIRSFSNGQDKEINVIYSRIARVCKNDTGVNSASFKVFTSYLKQRLVCSRTDDENNTIEYNEIEDFQLDGSTIYAIFTNEEVAPSMSALCQFDLDQIDVTFNTGNFYGVDGLQPTSAWQEYTGLAIDPRPGLDCANQNMADLNFLRDYNQMNDPAESTSTPFFMNGDRFSNLEVNGGNFTISSERGCLYQFEINSNVKDLGSPCVVPLVVSPIKDLELVSNDSYLVTSGEDVFILNNCSESGGDQQSECILSPSNGSYNVTPDSYFEIVYDASCSGLASISLEDGTLVTGSGEEAFRLEKNESLDTLGMLVHLRVHVMSEEMNVTFENVDSFFSINPNLSFTEYQLAARCDAYDLEEELHRNLTEPSTCGSATLIKPGTFDTDLIVDLGIVQDCSNCAYNSATEPCPSQ